MINTIGETLKNARRAMGLSAKKVQEITGINAVTIYRIESGATKTPHPLTIRTLKALLLGEKQV